MHPLEIPRGLWSRSRRSRWGMAARAGLTVVLWLMAAAYAHEPMAAIGLFLTGGLAFWLPPWIADGWLQGADRRLDQLAPDEAARRLDGLERRWPLRLLTPCAWPCQARAKILLRKGQAREAALGFWEAARLARSGTAPELRGAEAHAWLLAGERRRALEILSELERGGRLGPRERLDLGIALLEDATGTARALDHLESCRTEFPEEPLLLSALSLALAREGKIAEASDHLARAERRDAGGDALVKILKKRARKAVRARTEGRPRRGS